MGARAGYRRLSALVPGLPGDSVAGRRDELWDALFRLRVLEILLRTLLLVATVTGASILLALPLAWLTIRTDLPLARVWGVLVALPLVIPSYVAGFTVVVALGPRGMLQGFLESLIGIERLPDINGFPGAMLTLTLLSYPYVLLTVRAALQRLDPSLEDSSRSLGYSRWATYRRVIIPLLRPSVAAGGLLWPFTPSATSARSLCCATKPSPGPYSFSTRRPWTAL